MQSGTYFQFPICLLAYGQDVETRLSDIIAFCIVDSGRKQRWKMSLSEAKDKASRVTKATLGGPLPAGVRLSDSSHVEILLGMTLLNINGWHAGSILERAA